MRRFWIGGALASVVALCVGGCDSSSQGYGYSGGGGGNDLCSPYTTCGTCTPVQGCGWCFNRSGGACASSPDQCASSVSEFTWTWDPAGCPGVDASVVPVDASAPEGSAAVDSGITPESSAPESSTAAPDAPSEAATD
jgi:hypothetical protein